MSEWRRVAIELLPSLSKSICKSANRTELWDLLREASLDSTGTHGPAVRDAVVKYYRWCISPERQALPNDVQTSAVPGFLEKLVRTPALITILLSVLSKEEVLEYSWNIEYSAGQSAVEAIQKTRGRETPGKARRSSAQRKARKMPSASGPAGTEADD